jgi:hypothetical protein
MANTCLRTCTRDLYPFSTFYMSVECIQLSCFIQHEYFNAFFTFYDFYLNMVGIINFLHYVHSPK